ncbi:hypothetical protein BM536_031975 [Streptomyces phaeoluteigriseus]|uniref:Uncharacterized protein n=1 Tax=Streptomyces phaeoluteigriseus TaxID=114686 RepID=A0A1V6MJS1_9ACTN|nr:hypothetical protein [Streptomyces phaeoluteigriseus]OQD52730.1 hypothetical protein BM536_031975 [Streptomyces phaeoluteigriseus]
MEPVRTTYAAGAPEVLAAMVSNYRCGSCNGQVEMLTTDDRTGLMEASIRHDDNCPVLNGHVSVLGDYARAATIPDTFRR